ncbi:hypothetical protein BDR26DRAFT_1008635 [Obelidium mucronatum]|nr:hypothetical protein BDR26DRAFT_1008635 [Obelidium mucronatum]
MDTTQLQTDIADAKQAMLVAQAKFERAEEALAAGWRKRNPGGEDDELIDYLAEKPALLLLREDWVESRKLYNDLIQKLPAASIDDPENRDTAAAFFSLFLFSSSLAFALFIWVWYFWYWANKDDPSTPATIIAGGTFSWAAVEAAITIAVAHPIIFKTRLRHNVVRRAP